jgi:uncharacterized protein (TIGR04255 family)
MAMEQSALPDFESPPVVEVAISLQFERLESLRIPHLGVLWEVFRKDGYSQIEEHGELEPTFEEFGRLGGPRVRLRLEAFEDAPPAPRIWFLNEAKTELIQVQRDRIIVNWRQGAQSEPYPRYVHVLERFKSALSSLENFLGSENLGSVTPTQCEITYVNHIPTGPVWSRHGDLDRVVTTWRNRYSREYLPPLEDATFRARYRMGGTPEKPLGRLHVTVEPAYKSGDLLPILAIVLVARGKPEPADSIAAFQLFDREHEWIVRGFLSLTTPEMHGFWSLKNG